jgi:hypothetical protein
MCRPTDDRHAAVDFIRRDDNWAGRNRRAKDRVGAVASTAPGCRIERFRQQWFGYLRWHDVIDRGCRHCHRRSPGGGAVMSRPAAFDQAGNPSWRESFRPV